MHALRHRLHHDVTPQHRCMQARPNVMVRAHDQYKLKACGIQDADGVAYVCAEAFGTGNFPGVQHEQLDALEKRYMLAIEKDIKDKVHKALDKKGKATSEHREYRLHRQLMMMRAQLALLQGQRAVFPTQATPEQRRLEQRWRKSRQYLVLAVEDKRSSKLVATCTLSLMQPEALLPPPFPSNAPLRAYVSNMAVLDAHRRQGLAKTMLRQCMRIASMWGHEALYLHVHKTKEGAIALYQTEGFTRAESSLPVPTVLALRGEVLMKQRLPRRKRPCSSQLTSPTGSVVTQQQQDLIEKAAETALGGIAPKP